MSIRCVSHSLYGCADASSRFTSSSDTMRAARRVDEEDAARVQPLLEHDVLGRNVEHADLRRHDDQVVLGDVVARRTQAVAIEHGADHRAVGERDRRRAVPRLHQRRVVLVERLQLLRHASRGSATARGSSSGSRAAAIARSSRGTRARCRRSPCRCRPRGSPAGLSSGRRRTGSTRAALRARASS